MPSAVQRALLHPAWFHNLRANPAVRLGGEAFRAEVVADAAEGERLWALADRVSPPFADYRVRAAAAGRTIPIVRLKAQPRPVEGQGPNSANATRSRRQGSNRVAPR